MSLKEREKAINDRYLRTQAITVYNASKPLKIVNDINSMESEYNSPIDK